MPPSDTRSVWSIDIGHDVLPPVERSPGQLTVLDVTKWFGATSGGVRTYLEQKSAYVASRPWLRHVLVIPAERDVIEDRPQARWYRLRGPRIPSQSQYRFLLAVRSLRRIVEHEQPDVIEVGSPIFVPWIATLAARGTKIPIVSFYHTNLLTRSRSSQWAGRLHDDFLRGYARRIDRLFATTLVASAAAESDLWGAGLRRTTRVTLGVDIDMFNPSRRARSAAVRDAMGVAPDRRMVVYAGRLAREKSLPVAIEAFRQADLQRRADLVIVGDGPLAPELREQAKGLPIRFASFESDRPRLADLLAASDVYLAPGSLETFGLSSLEAMACGTPVVSADNWHGAFPLDAHEEFAAWCRTAAALGADLFLHGGRHDEVDTPRGWRDEVRAFGRTAREGEFLTLDKRAARDRIDSGLAMLRGVGLEPIGFVPPAWLARAECRDAVTESGLRLSEDDRSVYLHRRAQRLASPVVRWSARAAWRAKSSAMIAHASRWRYETRPLVRIALHPQDLTHPLTTASVERTLDEWLSVRAWGAYSGL